MITVEWKKVNNIQDLPKNTDIIIKFEDKQISFERLYTGEKGHLCYTYNLLSRDLTTIVEWDYFEEKQSNISFDEFKEKVDSHMKTVTKEQLIKDLNIKPINEFYKDIIEEFKNDLIDDIHNLIDTKNLNKFIYKRYTDTIETYNKIDKHGIYKDNIKPTINIFTMMQVEELNNILNLLLKLEDI